MEARRLGLLLMLSGALTTTNAQFENLQACLTPDFFAAFADCFVSTIVDGIDFVSAVDWRALDGPPGVPPGRRLQSVQPGLGLPRGPRQYYVDMRLREAGVRQDAVFDELARLGRLWSLTRSADGLSDKLRNLDLRRTFGDPFLSMLTGHLSEIMELVIEMRNYKAEDRPGTDDVLNLLGQEERIKLLDVVKCLRSFPESAFEDGLDWLQCLISCDGLGPLWLCTTEMMKTFSEPCSEVVWFANSLIAVMTSFLNKTHCHFVVDEPGDGVTLQLTEGGPETNVSFRVYLPPGVLCLGDPLADPIPLGLDVVGNVFGFNVTCDVEMQLTTSNWIDDLVRINRPKCRVPNRSLRQVAIGYHDATVNNSGVFKITDENWNATFDVPLLPVVDHRLDGDQIVSFTMKMFVQDLLRGDTIKINISVTDTDENDIVECYSLNDPHIMTFDGHYYNNFYHGAFYLYKHDEFPYEVQAIYQPCETGNKNGTCNCAVAVRSGDDVFVMDRCRRCTGSECDVNQLTALYTNGALTSGTRVFRMNGGLRHDVVLPHGTIIKIVTNNDLLNVWIMPGSYDREHTMGLCGTYNSNATDDLTMPDGLLYTGPGSGTLEQPRPFNEAWRVPEEELIFYGAQPLNESFTPIETCCCSHALFVGARCECGRGTLTELCDLFMENEYTSDNISSIITNSLNNGSMPNYLRNIDLDESYIPPNITGWNGVWNETAAQTFCSNLIKESNNTLIKECFSGPDLPVSDMKAIRDFCVQDIQILDNTNWQRSATDNAKFRCFNQFVRSTRTRVDDLEKYLNSSCVNDCNDNGLCDHGICKCYEGFHGPDCQQIGVEQPNLLQKTTELCDNRKQLCNFASVFGHNMPEDGSMLCQVTTVEISPEGVAYLPKRYSDTWEQVMPIISSNQAVCPLPKNASFEVYAGWQENTVPASWWGAASGLLDSTIQKMKRSAEVVNMDRTASVDVKFIFISYDSACYTCDVTTQSCQRKTTADHCIINSTCWAAGQTKPDDPCRYCAPNVSSNDWIMSNATVECVNRAIQEEQDEEERIHNMMLRGAIGGSLSALVVIIAIIMFCVSKKKEKAPEADGSIRRNSSTNVAEPLSTNDGQANIVTVYGYQNLGMTKEDKGDDGIYQTLRSGVDVDTPTMTKRTTRVEILKNEERRRTYSGSSLNSTESDTEGTVL